MSADEAASRGAMTFSALDENSDGIIDTQEWSSTATPAMSEDLAGKHFDKLDADASGAITEEEYSEARASMPDETQTSSTDAAGTSTDQTASTQTDNAERGISVFLYRFSLIE